MRDRAAANVFAIAGKNLAIDDGLTMARSLTTPSEPYRSDRFVGRTAVGTGNSADCNGNVPAGIAKK